MNMRSQIVQMLDNVPEQDLPTIFEVILHFIPAESDDIATPEDLRAHDIAMAEYLAGETTPHDMIDWD